ncbi:DUF4085 family protein [Paenibacillus hodogayensis]|uniref:DUF4085 family protein n=1 Tax=Paenibacillus hodogayensis TaxID=279208 RepID=A0ABV5W8J9_9BACL
MKYLTKEWYDLCQRTGLHFGMRVHNGAHAHDEALYLRLYKRKEKEFVNMQREVYDVDPRFMLEQDGTVLVPLHTFSSGDEISEEDTIVYHMPSEEKARIQKLIADYDARPPFDEIKCKQEFSRNMEWRCREEAARLPRELFSQIADMRVFALGYCTKDVLRELKKRSEENERNMKLVLDEFTKMQQAQHIPETILETFNFHDCKVTEWVSGQQVVIRLDTQGGFTAFNKVTFVAAEIIKQEDHFVGSTWIYNELYRIDNGYEVHMLFAGKGMPELILRCHDIVIEKE